jgi:ABC-type uncharacterized transport system permease subunit
MRSSVTLPLLIAVAATYLAAALLYVKVLVTQREPVARWARRTLMLGFILHTLSFVAFHLGKVHEGTQVRESVSFMAYAIIGLWLVFQHQWRAKVLGAFLSPLAFILVFYATLPIGTTEPLSTLRSLWSHFHIVLSIIGFGFLALAFAAGGTYLVQDRKLKSRRTKEIARVVFRLPSLEALERMNGFGLIYGFPILTLGMITGALWEARLGDPWNWDLKITLSIGAWIFYVVILLFRFLAHQRGRRAALLSVLGFILLATSYLGGRALG